MDPSEIKKKIGRFRILVMGRANAGKTTVLQTVCNTRENPEIYNSAGKKIDATVLMASVERGEHDIENEMVFQNNPVFVFHDSCGFEAGSESEFDKVKAFIASRWKKTKLKDQLHAIWYCIPMDEASRAVTDGEIKFFSECDTRSIPVMVLFTKFDALYDTAYSELKSKGVSMGEAKELAPKHAEESFAKGPQLKLLYHSEKIRRPPKCHVCLPNMNSDDADCRPLIELTIGALDNEVLKQLFVSTQQTNLELCMKYAIERTLPKLFDSAETTAFEHHEDTIGNLGAWFPHIGVWDHHRRGIIDRDELGIQFTKRDVSFFILLWHQAMLTEDVIHRQDLRRSHRAEIRSRLLSVAFGSSPLESIVQPISAAVIIFEHSFYIFDKQRYRQDQHKSFPSFYVALEQYMASPHATAVREGISAAVQAYERAMITATRAYQENVLAWKANLLCEPSKRRAKEAFERPHEARRAFERSQKKEKESSCSKAKAEFIKTILEITLTYRLPRP